MPGLGSFTSRALAWLVLAVAYAGIAVLRWRMLDVPLERDEGEYAYFGQLLLRGFPPFHHAYTMKLPGTQIAYAAIMAVFGETARGIRLGLLVVNAATTVLLYLLARRLMGMLGALVTAVIFAWLSASVALLAVFGHATHFVLLPAVTGLLVLVRAVDAGRLRSLFAAGFLLGCAAVMKQPGAVFALFAMSWLAWRGLVRSEAHGRRLVVQEALLASGAAAPLALVAGWSLLGGTFSTFWQWVFRYAREYSGLQSWSDGAASLEAAAEGALPGAWMLWSLCAFGAALVAWRGSALRDRAFLLGLLAWSFLGVSAGLYYRPHYFILALPSAALLAGAGVHLVQQGAAMRRPRWAPALLALATVGAGCVQAGWAQRDHFFRRTPAQVSRAIYGANPFPESVEVARYLAQRTAEDDRIAVFGSEPQILFYARRVGASGHVYAYGLMEPQPLARAMQEEMAREVVTSRPAYLVWVLVSTSWLEGPRSERWIFDWARGYLASEYELVGQVRILTMDRTEYLWEEDARRAPVLPVPTLLVFRRKDFAAPKRSLSATLGEGG